MTEPEKLTGKVALVTGGSRGIGAALALSLAEAGADVAISARDRESLAVTCNQIESTGRRCLAVAFDVSRVDSIPEGITAVERDLGPNLATKWLT